MSQQVADPYSNEPKRHPALLVRQAKPFNAETPAELLTGKLYTPSDLFYVRNHLPVPSVDPAAYTVRPSHLFSWCIASISADQIELVSMR